MGRTAAFASVVMTVQDSTNPVGPSHRSHSPANTNSWPRDGRMKWGTFRGLAGIHSKNPDAGIRQRRDLKALRNEGLSLIVSALAFVVFAPIHWSFAHDGISPHRSGVNSRLPSG